MTLRAAAGALIVVGLFALGFFAGSYSAEERFIDELCTGSRGIIRQACEAEGWRP